MLAKSKGETYIDRRILTQIAPRWDSWSGTNVRDLVCTVAKCVQILKFGVSRLLLKAVVATV